MPDPGSHRFDIRRTRLRDEYDDEGVPDQHADRAASSRLEGRHPPRPHGDRAGGPNGDRGTSRGDPAMDEPPRPIAAGIELRSPAFSDHTLIPERYSYEGGNTSPPLEWTHVPDGAAELVLLCEDPDAPGGTFVHWVVTGVPPDVTGAGEDGLPDHGIPGRNGFGELGWGGPRPPAGDQAHRYFFRLFAADRPLGLGAGAGIDDVRSALDGHAVATGTLVGLFGR